MDQAPFVAAQVVEETNAAPPWPSSFHILADGQTIELNDARGVKQSFTLNAAWNTSDRAAEQKNWRAIIQMIMSRAVQSKSSFIISYDQSIDKQGEITLLRDALPRLFALLLAVQNKNEGIARASEDGKERGR